MLAKTDWRPHCTETLSPLGPPPFEWHQEEAAGEQRRATVPIVARL